MTAQMTPRDAAYTIARIAWPNERLSSLMEWYERLIEEPDMLARTYELADERLRAQRDQLVAAKQIVGGAS